MGREIWTSRKTDRLIGVNAFADGELLSKVSSRPLATGRCSLVESPSPSSARSITPREICGKDFVTAGLTALAAVTGRGTGENESKSAEDRCEGGFEPVVLRYDARDRSSELDDPVPSNLRLRAVLGPGVASAPVPWCLTPSCRGALGFLGVGTCTSSSKSMLSAGEKCCDSATSSGAELLLSSTLILRTLPSSDSVLSCFLLRTGLVDTKTGASEEGSALVGRGVSAGCFRCGGNSTSSATRLSPRVEPARASPTVLASTRRGGGSKRTWRFPVGRKWFRSG